MQITDIIVKMYFSTKQLRFRENKQYFNNEKVIMKMYHE